MSKTTAPSKKNGLEQLLARLDKITLLKPLVEGILPRLRLLKDEFVQLEIHMALYRVRVGQWLAAGCAALLLIAGPLTVAAQILQWQTMAQIVAGLVAILSLAGFLKGLHEMLLHRQWRFIITNKRVIIVTPDPERPAVADAIYLQRGKIQVVDTNWSPNLLWGFFQAATGARDVVISLVGYEFKPDGAMVKGGLRFPDVSPADIAQLEELIFG